MDNIEENLIKIVHKLKGCEPEEDKDDENLLSEIGNFIFWQWKFKFLISIFNPFNAYILVLHKK